MCSVALSLIFLLDASGSFAGNSWNELRDAHAEALAQPRIERVIEDQGIQAAVITYSANARIVINWTPLYSAADVANFAARVQGIDRGPASVTNTHVGLRTALDLLETAPCSADNAVIDLATDTDRDVEALMLEQRDRAINEGVTINVLLAHPNPSEGDFDWLREHAVTPNGFIIHAATPDDYLNALRRKLVMEIANVKH